MVSENLRDPQLCGCLSQLVRHSKLDLVDHNLVAATEPCFLVSRPLSLVLLLALNFDFDHMLFMHLLNQIFCLN